jgi:Raf kinase inhibitor-like YbhB/YbcL family protein
MRISSLSFAHNGEIARKHTCEGDGVSPPLRFDDVPIDAKSLCLIVHDHDAPGGDFVHWLMWNIPPGTFEIEAGSVPKGAREGTTDLGTVGWGGLCPPAGKHRYEFHLYALNAQMDLPEGSNKKEVRDKMNGKVMEETSIVALYERFR